MKTSPLTNVVLDNLSPELKREIRAQDPETIKWLLGFLGERKDTPAMVAGEAIAAIRPEGKN